MKALLKFSMLVVIATGLVTTFTYGQVSEKFYSLTDEGAYEFTYWQCDDAAKAANHPVTIRTFYLETKRQGILPESLGYKAFLELSVEEQKALIYFSQQDVIAAMQEHRQGPDYKTIEQWKEELQAIDRNSHEETDVEDLRVNIPSPSISQDMNYQPTPFKEEKQFNDREEEVNATIPWMVQAITQPTSRYEIPAIIKNPPQDIKDEEAITTQHKEADNSWLISAITQPGSEVLQNNRADVAPVSNKKRTMDDPINKEVNNEPLYVEVTDKEGIIHQFLVGGEKTHRQNNERLAMPANATLVANEHNSDRKARLLALLKELFMIQDDEIARKYGKVFPGIDGKLYGTSEAELEEILTALMKMKEEILAGSDENVQNIFNELEALASR